MGECYITLTCHLAHTHTHSSNEKYSELYSGLNLKFKFTRAYYMSSHYSIHVSSY
jgi:hypothetical protein